MSILGLFLFPVLAAYIPPEKFTMQAKISDIIIIENNFLKSKKFFSWNISYALVSISNNIFIFWTFITSIKTLLLKIFSLWWLFIIIWISTFAIQIIIFLLIFIIIQNINFDSRLGDTFTTGSLFTITFSFLFSLTLA